MVVRDPSSYAACADVVAYAQDGSPVVVVEVKNRDLDDVSRTEAIGQLARSMSRMNPPVDFGLLAEPSRIVLVQTQDGDPFTVASLKTSDVTRPYDPDFGTRRIFLDYFASLIEAWLRDVAYRWKSPHPPGIDVLEACGIADRIAGGTTRVEVPIGDPVP